MWLTSRKEDSILLRFMYGSITADSFVFIIPTTVECSISVVTFGISKVEGYIY